MILKGQTTWIETMNTCAKGKGFNLYLLIDSQSACLVVWKPDLLIGLKQYIETNVEPVQYWLKPKFIEHRMEKTRFFGTGIGLNKIHNEEILDDVVVDLTETLNRIEYGDNGTEGLEVFHGSNGVKTFDHMYNVDNILILLNLFQDGFASTWFHNHVTGICYEDNGSIYLAHILPMGEEHANT